MLMTKNNIKENWKMKKCNVIAKSLLIAFVLFVYVGLNSSPTKAAVPDSQIIFLDLFGNVSELNEHKGDATLFKTIDANKKEMYGLIDSGSGSAAQYAELTNNLARTMGTKKLRAIIVTHFDLDHAGGFERLINDGKFVDSNTKLYIKDITTFSSATDSTDAATKNLVKRCDAIKAAAKKRGMEIAKILPQNNVAAATVTKEASTLAGRMDYLRNKAPNNMFQTKISRYNKNAAGSYVLTSTNTTGVVQFGQFEMTFYNGYDWNKTAVVPGSYNENINSLSILLKGNYTGSNSKVTTLISGDLGAYSENGATVYVAERISKLTGKISIYQIPHHGYYGSLTPWTYWLEKNKLQPTNTIRHLSPKHAIATTSYQSIAYKGVNKINGNTTGVLQKFYDTDTKRLSAAFDTVKEVSKSPDLQKVYFIGGNTKVKESTSKYRLINMFTTEPYAEKNASGDLKKGNVTVNIFSTSYKVVQ